MDYQPTIGPEPLSLTFIMVPLLVVVFLVNLCAVLRAVKNRRNQKAVIRPRRVLWLASALLLVGSPALAACVFYTTLPDAIQINARLPGLWLLELARTDESWFGLLSIAILISGSGFIAWYVLGWQNEEA